MSWVGLRNQIASILRQTLSPPDCTQVELENASVAGVLLCGIMVLSDWIASNRELYQPPQPSTDYRSYYEYCCLGANSALFRLGFSRPVSLPQGDFTACFPAIASPRPIQRTVQTLVGHVSSGRLAIIEAPMGEGKTEAALYLASQWGHATEGQGLYVALPTAATSNQMYGRVREFLLGHDPTIAATIRLIHGMAWLVDQETPQSQDMSDDPGSEDALSARQWFQPSKRALLAPAAVGTIDQALMSVLHVRYGFLRLFGLSSKTVIIDEAHAYDAYMMEELTLLLRWLSALSVSVIVLSATLPEAKRNELCQAYMNPEIEGMTTAFQGENADAAQKGYPLITIARRGEERPEEIRVEGSAKAQTVYIKKHAGLLDQSVEVASLLLELAAKGGCVACIASTIRSAQAIYRALCQHGEKDVFLFHARFTAERRGKIEQEVLDHYGPSSLYPYADLRHRPRPDRAILVATQVIEQSLDLDFDVMVSDIAPIDLLLQRAGRLHRHARQVRPTGREAMLHVLLPADGNLFFGPPEKVYERFLLLKTVATLKGIEQIDVPGDMRRLIETVYDDVEGHFDTENEDLCVATREAYETFIQKREEERQSARNYLWPWPDARSFQVSRIPGRPFSDDEPDAVSASFLAAKTRLERRPSVRTLMLDGDAFADVLASQRFPGRDTLRSLLLQSVSIPLWWIVGAQPAGDFGPVQTAPRWLCGYRILRLQQGVWQGYQNGKFFTIIDDPLMGVVRADTED